MNESQRRRFTIIGNHLAQHRALSLTAIGLATHIQSLPEGASVDILTLSSKFTEGRDRVAAALRELEAHGYLRRIRERTPEGRIVTRTISYNHPEATRDRLALEAAAHGSGRAQGKHTSTSTPEPDTPAWSSAASPARRQQRSRPVRGGPAAPPAPRPARRAPAPSHPPRPGGPGSAAAAPRPTSPVPTPPSRPETTTPEPAPNRLPAPVPVSPAVPAPTPRPTAQARPAPPPLPEPQVHNAERHDTAVALLAGLHRDEPRLLLSERDVRRLAPGVAAWLERGAAPDSVRRTLTNGLPADPHHPAALLAHRLTELLPPPLPLPAGRVASRPDPLQNCDGCDRAYRAPEPGKCRACEPLLLS